MMRLILVYWCPFCVSAQIQNFRLSDYAILFYVHDVNFSVNTFISCKRYCCFPYVCCSQHNFSEIARVWMLHLYSEIPQYSGYFGLGVCEIIRLNLNHIYLKR